MGEPHEIDVRLDGVRLRRFTIGGEGRGMTAPESFAGNTQGDPQWEVYMHTADEGLRVRVPVTAGAHEISVSFVRRFWEPEGILQPPQRGFARTTNELYHGHPAVDNVAVTGPLRARERPDAGATRRRRSPRAADALFVLPGGRRSQPPNGTARAASCRARGVARLSPPRHRGELDTLLHFYDAGRAGRRLRRRHPARARARAGGADVPLPRRREPAGRRRGTAFPLSDLELASRLSFFLWSSVPDDALRLAASKGRLR